MGLDMMLLNNNDEKVVMAWRKANQIRYWFVRHFKQEKKENEIVTIKCVCKQDLKDLLNTIEKVLSDNDKSKDLLPTRSGFFFGSTDYDEDYFMQLFSTYLHIAQFVISMQDDDTLTYDESW